MSNFVNGLVRRGAGLPLPIMMRPSVSPRNMPVSLDSHTANIASLDPSLASSPAESTQPAAIGPMIVDSPGSSAVRVQVYPQIPRLEPLTPLRLPERLPSETKEALAIPEEAPAAAQPLSTQQITIPDKNRPGPHASHTVQGAQIAIAPKPVASAPLLPASQGHEATQPGHASRGLDSAMPPRHGHRSSGDPPRQATLEVAPTRVVPRQAATLAVSVRQAPAAASKKQAGVRSEPRNVQVKIGRVEIRSSQPAAPARAMGKQATGGFAGLKLARTYLDRSGW